MYHAFRLGRWVGIGLLALMVVCAACAAEAQPPAKSELSNEFDGLFQQIVALRDAGLEVPPALYDRYFELQRNLYPIPDERHSRDRLDAMDGCPGSVVRQPPPGQHWDVTDNGATDLAHDNCTLPRCRAGRDVHYQLILNHPAWLRLSTCGSSYDTYLCVFRDSCCAGEQSRVMINEDNRAICGPNALQAAISACFADTGTYYVTLDGTNSGALGHYTFHLESIEDSLCEPPIPCTHGYHQHSEVDHPNDEVCVSGTSDTCGVGYCGEIGRLGDRDVYYFTLPACRVVTLSAFANDTPGRSGYHGGLDPSLRLFSGTACDHPIYTSAPGIDASIVTDSLRAGIYWLEITGGETTGKYEFLITCQPCH